MRLMTFQQKLTYFCTTVSTQSLLVHRPPQACRLGQLLAKSQHPYARMGDHNTHPGEHPGLLNCPRNGHALAAPAAWREQARSVQSNNITAHALLVTLASSHVDTTSPLLNVRGWVDNIASYLQDPAFVNLGGGSIGDTINRCRSTFHQETGSSFVSMLTYMQLAIQCQRYPSLPQA